MYPCQTFIIVTLLVTLSRGDSVYFPFNDITMNIPKSLTESNKSLVVLHAKYLKLTDATNSSDINAPDETGAIKTYNIKQNGAKVFSIDDNGFVKLSTRNILPAKTATADVGFQNPREEATFNVNVNVIADNHCVDMLPDLCFWSHATFAIYENSDDRVFIGNAGPQYYHYSKCLKFPIFQYAVVKGKSEGTIDVLKEGNTLAWGLYTTRSFDRETQPSFTFQLRCTLEEDLYVTKNHTLTILDVNDNPPTPQMDTIMDVYVVDLIIIKGKALPLDEQIWFIDKDSIEISTHTYYLQNDYLQLFELTCNFHMLKNLKVYDYTAINCYLHFSQSEKLRPLNYTVFLIVNDTTLPVTNLSNPVSNITINVHFGYKNFKPLTVVPPTTGKIYRNLHVEVLRSAGLYARIIQPPHDWLRNAVFDIDQPIGTLGVFYVTQSEGIVYVDRVDLLRRVNSRFNITISASLPNNTKLSDTIHITMIEDEQNRTCVKRFDNHGHAWPPCSRVSKKKLCESSCGIGVGGSQSTITGKTVSAGVGHCIWRRTPPEDENYEQDKNEKDKFPGDNVKKILPLTKDYHTCTHDEITCPDGICDALEQLHIRICPQDCTEEDVHFGEHNPSTNRGIFKGTDTCSCDETASCGCMHPNDLSKPKTVGMTKTKKDKRQCGPICICSIFISIILMVICLIAVATKTRVCSVLNNLDRDKFINQSETMILSEYTNQQTSLENKLGVSSLNTPLQFKFTNDSTLGKRMKPNDTKWEFPRDNLKFEETIGEGEFGRVIKAKALGIYEKSGYTTVAVKTLKEHANDRELSDLISEYELLKDVSHPNVIRLLGACTSPDGPFYLIIEYAQLGSLRNYLRKFRQKKLKLNSRCESESGEKKDMITPKDILLFAWQISKGMTYLGDVKLVHRDLAARNVLLSSEKICKISDFGLTRDVYEDNAYLKKSNGRVPIKWMAPESLSDQVYTSRSDVWSFGVLLWELVTLGASPYPGVAVENLFRLLKTGYRMDRPENCSKQLYEIMRRCWDLNQHNRPTFRTLTEKFETMLDFSGEYLNLNIRMAQNQMYFQNTMKENNLNASKKSSSKPKRYENFSISLSNLNNFNQSNEAKPSNKNILCSNPEQYKTVVNNRPINIPDIVISSDCSSLNIPDNCRQAYLDMGPGEQESLVRCRSYGDINAVC